MGPRSLGKLLLLSKVLVGFCLPGCGLIRPRFVDYKERDGLGSATNTTTDSSSLGTPGRSSTSSAIGTGQELKTCALGVSSFKTNMASKISPKTCSCHGNSAPMIGAEDEANRLNLLAAKRIFQYDWLTGVTHLGGENFKKITQAEWQQWKGVEVSSCGVNP